MASSETPSNRSPSDPMRPGTRIAARAGNESPKKLVRMGQYDILQHIASGGMGAVYRARDTRENREVALKILSPEMASRPAMLERFRREARSARKLVHENIVAVYDIDEIKGAHFIIMEFIDGPDLHDYVKRKGPLDPEEARQIVLQAARALKHAGSMNIIHRDIKPSNFLLTRKNGRPLIKLTDFGLAREVDAEEFRVTRAGTTVGTVDYMSPEQAKDSSAADTRSDLYSLGCTWFHLLAGHAPFPEGGLGERLIKIMTEQPPDIRDINPRVSDECWAVLDKLLEKKPDDRFRSPTELIETLVALEGCAVARPRAAKPARKKPSRRLRTDETPRKKKSNPTLWYILGGVAAVLFLASVITFLAWPRTPRDTDDHAGTEPPPVVPTPGPITPRPGPIEPPDTPVKPVEPVPPVAAKTIWPALYTPENRIDVRTLRQDVEKPFGGTVLSTGEPVVARVARIGPAGTYRTLAEAVAATPADKPTVIEIHDNGPLFETPVRAEGRRLTLRAGAGYRPLILWDLPATLDQRRREKKLDQPLVWMALNKGRLRLQGLELALRWPEGLAEAATLIDLTSGELEIADCTISAAGKPAKPITLARLHGEAETIRARFTRLHARGRAMTALDLDVTGGEVLYDGCLIAGGSAPIFRLVGLSARGPRLSLVGSTVLGSGAVFDVRTGIDADKTPALSVFAWDTLLARAGPDDGGELLRLGDELDSRNVDWRAVNSLYVGFRRLLGGSTTISGTNGREWRRHWKRTQGDDAINEPWPEQSFSEPATQPAATYQPTRAVGFASTASVEKALGCEVASLPPSRDAWPGLALDPNLTPVEFLADANPPEIPAPNDGMYHGGRIDLSAVVNLGEELAKLWQKTKPGPKVVLHLAGKGDHTSSSIKLDGSSLVLYFEEPADDKTPRLALKASEGGALLDVKDGNIEVINGLLKVPDVATSRTSHLIRVKGGDVKLYRTRLEGPQSATPANWQAAVSVAGSGEYGADKARICAVNECVVLSSKSGLALDGVGQRLAVRQSLLVAGTDAVVLRPGKEARDRANVQATLEQTTIAAREAVVRLGDGGREVPLDPVVIQTRDCAILNPFDRQKPGLLVFEGEALPRGLVMWRSERDALDQRIHYGARKTEAAIPERKEDRVVWSRLWGTHAIRSPRPELFNLPVFDGKQWTLRHLILRIKDAPGADLEKLGISTRKPPR